MAGTVRLSINPPAEGFGGKDSVKGNRQGSLSRWINNFLKLQKSFKKFVSSLEKRLFQQADRPRVWRGRFLLIYRRATTRYMSR